MNLADAVKQIETMNEFKKCLKFFFVCLRACVLLIWKLESYTEPSYLIVDTLPRHLLSHQIDPY